MITTLNETPNIINEGKPSVSIPLEPSSGTGVITHTLLKGLQKVNGEMNLIMFCYNFMRTKNILGIENMLKAIEKWTPDYDKVIGAIKKALIKAIYSQNAAPIYLKTIRFNFLQVA